MLLCIAAAGFTEAVSVGLYQTPPLMFSEADGSISGPYPDILREVASREGWQLEWVEASWPQCLEMLGSGGIDLLPAIAYTQERDSLYDFTSETVLSNWAVVFGPPGNDLESILDLDSLRLSVLSDDVYYIGFRETAKKFGINCVYLEQSSYDSVMMALEVGGADAALVPRLYAAREGGRFAVERTPILCCPIELRFAVPPGQNGHIVQALDSSLREFKRDPGSIYHRSLNNWLGISQVESVKAWLWWVLAGLAAAASILLFVMVLTRREVRKATAELRREIADRERIQAALKSSEERYRALFQQSREGFFLIDANRKIRDVNARTAELAGHSVDDLIGRDCVEDFYPERRLEERGKETFQQILDQGESRFESQIVRGDGTVIPVEVSSSIVEIEGETMILGTVRDISARRRAESALRESHAQMQAILDGSPDIISLLDTDLTIRWANRAAQDICGSPIGLSCYKAYSSGDEPCELCPVPEAISSGRIETEVTRRSTSEDEEPEFWEDTAVPVSDEQGNISGVILISRNVTEQLKARERLRASEEKYRSVVEGSRDAIIIHRKGNIIFANVTSFAATGYSPEDLLGRNVLEFVVPEQREMVRERMKARVSDQDVPSTYEITLITRDRGLLPVEMSASIIQYEGKPAYMIFLRDISERITLENQLRQAQKMEAVGQLAGGVAHDFNNLLQVISGYTEMASKMLPSEHPAMAKLREVSSAGERAASLVKQLLAFSRNRMMDPELVSVDEMVRAHLKLLRRVISENIELVLNGHENLPAVRVDRGMLEQVTMNLFLNARDAMPNGGSISVTLKEVELDNEFCSGYPWTRPGTYVRIGVADSGYGMEPEVLERVFEPFFSTKEQGSGTGLGLSTVYGIVKQHGGIIKASSRPGQGSIFDVFLPATDGRPEPGEGAGEQWAARGGTETILLAEDDDNVRSLAAEILREAGYEVITCSDGMEAVKTYHAAEGHVDLVLLDIIMPRMGGFEAAREILKRDPGALVLFCSGYSDRAVSSELTGLYGFLKKPYSRLELLQAVRKPLD